MTVVRVVSDSECLEQVLPSSRPSEEEGENGARSSIDQTIFVGTRSTEGEKGSREKQGYKQPCLLSPISLVREGRDIAGCVVNLAA